MSNPYTHTIMIMIIKQLNYMPPAQTSGDLTYSGNPPVTIYSGGIVLRESLEEVSLG